MLENGNIKMWLQKWRRRYNTDKTNKGKILGWGSTFTLCGSGSSSFSECRSGSRSRSSLTKFEGKKSWILHISCKKHKIAQVTNNGACPNYFKNTNGVEVTSKFLAFSQFFVDKFTLLDPEPHIECGSRSRKEKNRINADPDPQPCNRPKERKIF